MKKILFVVVYVLSFPAIFAQVKIATQKERVINKSIKYDSLSNYLTDGIYQYIGQELYIKPKSEELQKYGYEDFLNSMQRKDIFKKDTERAWYSDYNSLAGKTFKVIDVTKRKFVMGEEVPKHIGNLDSDYIYYLKLADKQDTIYYEYTQYESSFPFITLGYLDKIKKTHSNKTFYLKRMPDDTMTDFENGNIVNLIPNSIWKFKDAVLDGKSFDYILLTFTNEKKETVYTEDFRMKFMFIEKTLADRLKGKYGTTMYNTAMNGKIAIGMPKELVKLAWGDPSDINKASYGDQWVYDNQYVYLKNGIVTAFN